MNKDIANMPLGVTGSLPGPGPALPFDEPPFVSFAVVPLSSLSEDFAVTTLSPPIKQSGLAIQCGP
jgi:hypothetical protein